MPRQSLTRITAILPVPTNLGGYLVVDEFISDLVQFCGGATVTSQFPSAIHGRWFDPSAQKVLEEDTILILADTPVPINSSDLQAYLDIFKLHAQEDLYQDIIWITLHQVERIITHD